MPRKQRGLLDLALEMLTPTHARTVTRAVRAVARLTPEEVQQAMDIAQVVGKAFRDSWQSSVVQVETDPAVDAARTLGLEWPCTKDEVTVAFRIVAKSTHPDGNNPDATYFVKAVDAKNYLLGRIQT